MLFAWTLRCLGWGKWMAEWGSLACEIILAGNLLFRFIMKFFYSEQWGSNSRYIRCFLWRASLARLSVRLILGLAASRGSSKFCSRFETEASPWFWRWTCALNAYKSFQRQKKLHNVYFFPWNAAESDIAEHILCAGFILTSRIIPFKLSSSPPGQSVIPWAVSPVACFIHCSLSSKHTDTHLASTERKPQRNST